MWWDRLGDDELLRRLVQRGVAPEQARYYVTQRDRSPAVRRTIHRHLGDE